MKQTGVQTGRTAYVLIDGIGDVVVPTLSGKTPLQAAHTPVLDAIAGWCAAIACILHVPNHTVMQRKARPCLVSHHCMQARV